MEQGWTEREKTGGPGGVFLRLKGDKDKAAITLLDQPVRFLQHFIDKKSSVCTKRETGKCAICEDESIAPKDRYPSERFVIAVYVHSTFENGAIEAQKVGEVQILEQSGGTYDALLATVQELEDDWNKRSITIKREGVGLKTRYHVVAGAKNIPVPTDIVIPDLAAYYADQIGVKQETAPEPAKAAEKVGASGLKPIPPGGGEDAGAIFDDPDPYDD